MPADPAIDNPLHVDGASQCINQELTQAQRIQQKKNKYLKADRIAAKPTQAVDEGSDHLGVPFGCSIPICGIHVDATLCTICNFPK